MRCAVLAVSLLIGIFIPPVAGIGALIFLVIASRRMGAALAAEGKRIEFDSSTGWIDIVPPDDPDSDDS